VVIKSRSDALDGVTIHDFELTSLGSNAMNVVNTPAVSFGRIVIGRGCHLFLSTGKEVQAKTSKSTGVGCCLGIHRRQRQV
jgi:hypothetical protein